MSTKATDEPECESVAAAQLVESSVKLKNTIKPSDEFLQILNFSKNSTELFNKRYMRTMEAKLKKLYDEVINSENTSFDDIVTLAHCYGILCYVHVCFDDKKHISSAKYFISCSLNLLKDKELHPKSILITLKIYYFLGFIYSKQQKLDKAIESYDKAIQLYFIYTRKNEECDTPIDLTDNSKPHAQVNGYEKLELMYIDILEAAVTIHNEKEPINMNYIIAYQHLLLAVQLSKLQKTKQYPKLINETLTLCNTLLNRNRFTEARNHITTASSVRKAFLIEKYMSAQLPTLLKEYTDMTVHIITCSITYGVRFLRTSAARLLRLEGDFASNDLKLEYPIKWMSHILQTLISFDEMKGGNPFPDFCDHSMMVKSISGYDDAHKLFSHTLYQLRNFKFGYIFTKEVGLNMKFSLDTSNVYKYMALYEKDSSQILLQNRHVEILSRAAKEETYLMRPFMLKRLQLQLAIGYSILIDAKLETLEEIDSVYMPQKYYAIMCEIKNLVEKALMNLKMYTQPVESQ